MRHTIEEQIIDGVYYSSICGNKEANEALNSLIKRYGNKKKYKIYAKAGNCDVLHLTPCSIYVKKYDGRMKKYKPVAGYMTDFRVWFEYYIELAKRADEGVIWEYIQKGDVEILMYNGIVKKAN